MEIETRSQVLAKQIHQQMTTVAAWKGEEHGRNGEKAVKEYSRLCMKFPYLVLSNGLLQAVAFVRQKIDDRKAQEVGDHMARKVFLEHLAAIVLPDDAETDEVDDFLIHNSFWKSLQATRSALDAAIWYKRFAQSMLGAKPEDRE